MSFVSDFAQKVQSAFRDAAPLNSLLALLGILFALPVGVLVGTGRLDDAWEPTAIAGWLLGVVGLWAYQTGILEDIRSRKAFRHIVGRMKTRDMNAGEIIMHHIGWLVVLPAALVLLLGQPAEDSELLELLALAGLGAYLSNGGWDTLREKADAALAKVQELLRRLNEYALRGPYRRRSTGDVAWLAALGAGLYYFWPQVSGLAETAVDNGKYLLLIPLGIVAMRYVSQYAQRMRSMASNSLVGFVAVVSLLIFAPALFFMLLGVGVFVLPLFALYAVLNALWQSGHSRAVGRGCGWFNGGGLLGAGGMPGNQVVRLTTQSRRAMNQYLTLAPTDISQGYAYFAPETPDLRNNHAQAWYLQPSGDSYRIVSAATGNFQGPRQSVLGVCKGGDGFCVLKDSDAGLRDIEMERPFSLLGELGGNTTMSLREADGVRMPIGSFENPKNTGVQISSTILPGGSRGVDFEWDVLPVNWAPLSE